MKKIRYNSPVILTFALLCLAILGLDKLTAGASTARLFCVYRSSLRDPLTYPRFFLHVLGHSSMSHYMGNILLMLVVGPPLEERFGSKRLLLAMAVTALSTGLVQFIFFPGSALLGASGIVFMLIVMLSMTGRSSGSIPLTMLVVLALYLGQQVIDGIFTKDNISQLTHILGGVCGVIIGNVYYTGGRGSNSRRRYHS
ncbi:MAG: rhomboid family intramembrane serine protease [Oscillospiraceae bacterium]|nr:rhomboid family intramembrane serine protease [Oscillospiraceae bacterium]